MRDEVLTRFEALNDRIEEIFVALYRSRNGRPSIAEELSAMRATSEAVEQRLAKLEEGAAARQELLEVLVRVDERTQELAAQASARSAWRQVVADVGRAVLTHWRLLVALGLLALVLAGVATGEDAREFFSILREWREFDATTVDHAS